MQSLSGGSRSKKNIHLEMNSHLTFFSVFISLAGINKQIAVDAVYIPVVSSSEPQAVGLPQDPHGNTMLSCLSSGFLCPLSNTANNSEETLPRPGSHCGGDNVHSGSICRHMHLLHLIFKMCVFWVFFPAEEILATASELEDTHVVCILDLCHLGGDKVEVMISKVYRLTEVSLD